MSEILEFLSEIWHNSVDFDDKYNSSYYIVLYVTPVGKKRPNGCNGRSYICQ